MPSSEKKIGSNVGLIFFFVYFLVSITNFFSPEDVKNTPPEVLFLDNNMNSTTNSLFA